MAGSAVVVVGSGAEGRDQNVDGPTQPEQQHPEGGLEKTKRLELVDARKNWII